MNVYNSPDLRLIPLTEEDVTIVEDKGIVIISKEKFANLLRYVEDLQDQLAFAHFDLQEEKAEKAALSTLSEGAYRRLKKAQTIPERIQVIVEARELPIERLAKSAGLPYTTIHRMVRGETQSIKAEALVKVAHALKVPETLLIRGIQEKDTARETTSWKKKMAKSTKASL